MTAVSVKAFAALDAAELYAILQLRSDVFVVEQDCVYQDMDGIDPDCIHLSLQQNGRLMAYCRLVPPGLKYPEWSIGRVISSKEARGQGLGHILLQQAKAEIAARGGQNIRISAQNYLEKFYRKHGFATVSEPYPEDGIPHVEMLFTAA